MVAKALFDPIRSLASGSISGTYANVGDPFEAPCRLTTVANPTDSDLMWSTDGGVTDHFVVLAGTSAVFDIQSNMNSLSDDSYVLPAGSQLAVKTAPANFIFASVLR